MEFENCICGELCDIEDLVRSEVSDKMTCPSCGIYCPNCNKLISEKDLSGYGCVGCDTLL